VLPVAAQDYPNRPIRMIIALIAAETARWRKVVKETGVKVQAE